MGNFNWTDAQIARLATALRAGKSVSIIAKDSGRSVDSVRKKMAALGLQTQEPAPYVRPTFWSDAKLNELVRLFDAGVKHIEIAKTLGCSTGGVRAKISSLRQAGTVDAVLARRVVGPPRQVNNEFYEVQLCKDAAACRQLALAVNRLGGHRDAVVKAPLTFDERLALVAAGKARVVDARGIAAPAVGYRPQEVRA